jgi:hypothetical protein
MSEITPLRIPTTSRTPRSRFFRNRLWERLMVNVGIVLVFAAFYLRFFRRS